MFLPRTKVWREFEAVWVDLFIELVMVRTALVSSHLQYSHCGCGNHLHCRSQR